MFLLAAAAAAAAAVAVAVLTPSNVCPKIRSGLCLILVKNQCVELRLFETGPKVTHSPLRGGGSQPYTKTLHTLKFTRASPLHSTF